MSQFTNQEHASGKRTRVNERVVELSEHRISCRFCTLSRLCLPRHLNTEELESLETLISHPPCLQRHDRLFESGDEFSSLYIVKSGSLKVFALTEQGDEQVLGFYMPGDLLGMDGISGRKHVTTAVALEATNICEIHYDHAWTLCSSNPKLLRELYIAMSHEVVDDKVMIHILGKRTAEERMAIFFLKMAQRLVARGFSGSQFSLSMPRQDIASYLGLACETVSRILHRMQDEQLINVQRRQIKIENIEALQRMAKCCSSMFFPESNPLEHRPQMA